MILLCATAIAMCDPTAFVGSEKIDRDGKNRMVIIENLSGQPLRSLLISGWGYNPKDEDDLLKRGSLAPGASQRTNFRDGSGKCRFDVRLLMSDGRQVVRKDFDVCSVRRWVVTDEGDALHHE